MPVDVETSAKLVAREERSTPYPVRATDVLWLLRAVEAEGPDREEVAAVLVNGFVWARSMKAYRGTLTDWIRSYSSTVNPRWFVGGDKFDAELEHVPAAKREAYIAKAERRERVNAKRTAFSGATRAAVQKTLEGKVAFPPQATDFAAASVDAGAKGYRPLEQIIAGKNRLWSRPGAESWGGYAVILDPDAERRVRWFAYALGGLGVATVGAVAWWAVRRARRRVA